MGADHVLLGTDHPFELGDTHPVETVRALGLGVDETETILWRTAAELLDLPISTQPQLSSIRPGR
jgi:aminocarboxymuconate-semialdehyde decarboxylase